MSRRLLLVDDSNIMRRMMSSMLEKEGYQVETAEHGLDGLAKARANAPELIVSDYEMPEMDGPAFCKSLKADESLRMIPVIMLTTLGATESKVIGLDSGADDYIEKPKSPADLEEIFARIRAQLRIADLRHELELRNRQLEAAQAKLTLELNLARKVQMGLMPPPPRLSGDSLIDVRYRPANALGGDVYDFTRLDDGRLGILVADISGHGVNAALLSGMVKAIASPLTNAKMNPGAVLASLDTSVEQYFPEGFFCTAFYLLVNELTGAMEYAGVGHPPGLVVGPNGMRQLDGDPGLLGVGMASDTNDYTDQLAPGETLILYTDGLTDAMTPADVPFGQDRIQAVLERHVGAPPGEVVDALLAAITQHVDTGQPHDDINIVAIVRKP